jgi:hypothetical protein
MAEKIFENWENHARQQRRKGECTPLRTYSLSGSERRFSRQYK